MELSIDCDAPVFSFIVAPHSDLEFHACDSQNGDLPFHFIKTPSPLRKSMKRPGRSPLLKEDDLLRKEFVLPLSNLEGRL